MEGKNIKYENKRKKIIKSVLRILNKREYHSCPVDEIAKSAGVAKGTIYLYFKSKEELYFVVFFHMIARIQEIAREVFDSKLPASKQIYLFLRKVSTFTKKYKNIVNIMKPELRTIDRVTHEKMHQKFYELLRSVSLIIQKGIDEKEFKRYPPGLVAAMLLSFLPIIAQKDSKQSLIPGEISVKTITEVLLNGIKK